ncbi:transcription termination factor NusA [Marinivivus vitaminiproducens]|uniref:transcription termination factor NusA n=1 Tax=Marinivivus vitaminiproducens TaxID=3035935 RepID=UPI0027A8CCFA|nr:transcription termination factor NusA [Geminicoccaceae bacterium SCSIO 64248]
MEMTTASLGRGELLRVAETVAQEKGISTGEVLEAMEQAIQTAARRKYGQEHEILAEIDRKHGGINLYRQLNVVESVEEWASQISIEDARDRNPAAQVGDVILEPLPPIDLGRIAAQSAKQVIVQKVREAERERQYNEFKDRISEIVVGEVKRIEYGHVLVDLGRAEAIVRREELIPRELFRQKDRIRAYIYDVRLETRGPQIFLSRTHPQFLAKLFAQEVPEIYDGIIEIRAVARDPGSRAKMAVISKDNSIDPVGACVGMRGSRVQAVVSELSGEKIDIIPWSQDPATFVVNALAPAEVTRVVLDPESQRIEVVVPDAQQHIAIGRRGQNVRLASQLTGWDIDIVSETEDSERRNREFRELTSMFIDALNVEEVIAQLLVTEGYTSIDDLAYGEIEDLAGIQGFDEDIAQALMERAQSFVQERDENLRTRLYELEATDDLVAFELLSLPSIVQLAEKGVKSLDDLGDLATDELIELLPDLELDQDQAGEIIMAARAHWFEDEPGEVAEAIEEAEEAEALESDEPGSDIEDASKPT